LVEILQEYDVYEPFGTLCRRDIELAFQASEEFQHTMFMADLTSADLAQILDALEAETGDREMSYERVASVIRDIEAGDLRKLIVVREIHNMHKQCDNQKLLRAHSKTLARIETKINSLMKWPSSFPTGDAPCEALHSDTEIPASQTTFDLPRSSWRATLLDSIAACEALHSHTETLASQTNFDLRSGDELLNSIAREVRGSEISTVIGVSGTFEGASTSFATMEISARRFSDALDMADRLTRGLQEEMAAESYISDTRAHLQSDLQHIVAQLGQIRLNSQSQEEMLVRHLHGNFQDKAQLLSTQCRLLDHAWRDARCPQ